MKSEIKARMEAADITEGSEKQIKWANDIKKSMKRTCYELFAENKAYKDNKEAAENMGGLLAAIIMENNKHASYYIDNRVAFGWHKERSFRAIVAETLQNYGAEKFQAEAM